MLIVSSLTAPPWRVQQAILELSHSSSEKTNIRSLWSSFKV